MHDHQAGDALDAPNRLEVFQTVLSVNRRLATETDLHRAMEYLVQSAVSLAGGRRGFLLLREGGAMRMEVGVGAGAKSPFSRSLASRAIESERIVTESDVLADASLADMPSVQELRSRSAVCIPFASGSGVEGALYLEHPSCSGAFPPSISSLLQAFADQAAIAVDRLPQGSESVSVRMKRAVPQARPQSPGMAMLGESPAMVALNRQIDRLAASDLSILVLGETGTGKELVARALHQRSDRAGQHIVSENCAAISGELLESELFGHVKGAFTGAEVDRAGLLEKGDGGTLFLDEVGELSLAAQSKLLRVLQERCVRRVGCTESIPINVRIVSATHQDLEERVRGRKFREDLYYRVAGAVIRVPPLRSRGEDVCLLADAFVAQLNRVHGRAAYLTDAAKESLMAHLWPGNVRELQHVISRGFALSDSDRLTSLDLPANQAPGTGPTWPVISLREAESRTIKAVLKSTGGEKKRSARILGISRTALYEKLKRIGH